MTVPLGCDYTYGIKNWPALGNMSRGDCFEVAFEELRMAKEMAGAKGLGKLKRAFYRLGFTPPTSAQALQLYYDYGIFIGEKGPQPDKGTTSTIFYPWALSKGLIYGWAVIDITPNLINGEDWRTRLDTAMSDPDFHGCVLEVNLPATIWTQFYKHRTLDFDPALNTPFIGAHAVALLRYSERFYQFPTWGRLATATERWVENCRIFATVFVSPEDEGRPGFDKARALAKITALGGTVA